jgi:hypothetical protein
MKYVTRTLGSRTTGLEAGVGIYDTETNEYVLILRYEDTPYGLPGRPIREMIPEFGEMIAEKLNAQPNQTDKE